MTNLDVHGPIDFVLLEFPGDHEFTGEGAAALIDLVEAGIIRIFDILIVQKDLDGTFSGIDIEPDMADGLGASLVAFSGARSGLIGDDDLAAAADAMEPGTVAALIVYENTWAIGFVGAVRAAGGQMIASARIPAQDIMEALDALEAND